MEKRLSGNYSAKAAVDIALHDLWGKVEEKPLWELLGGSWREIATDKTIGLLDPEATIQAALRATGEGFRSLKIKVGGEVPSDIDRVRRVRDAVGPKIALRADANGGYTREEAFSFLKGTESCRLEFLEQPVPLEALEDLRWLADWSPVPVMLDETVSTAGDLRLVLNYVKKPMVNIKLMKCGGVQPALEIADLLRTHGLSAMIGCNGESQLSLAAAYHFAVGRDEIVYVDLDSHFNLKEDPAGGLDLVQGVLRELRAPGLGISVSL